MGVVYEAEQVSLGRHVALKVLPQHVAARPEAAKRFEREARSAARLHHTNIVPVFGVGEEGGLHYYVMQYHPGAGAGRGAGRAEALPEGSDRRARCRVAEPTLISPRTCRLRLWRGRS